MQIGIVAKRIGLSVDAIRFYQRNGLLPRSPRGDVPIPDYWNGPVYRIAPALEKALNEQP